MAAVRTTAGTMSPRHRPRRRHRRGPILRLTAATALLPGLLASSGDPVGADQNGTFTIGEVKAVEPASTTETPLRPGDTLTYTVNFSCSIAACDGATITDVLPAYTDLTGASAQLSYVSESSPPAWQFDGVSTNGDGRQQIGWTAQALPAGSSGAIFVTMRIPPGTVRVTADPQEIVNQAVGALASRRPRPRHRRPISMRSHRRRRSPRPDRPRRCSTRRAPTRSPTRSGCAPLPVRHCGRTTPWSTPSRSDRWWSPIRCRSRVSSWLTLNLNLRPVGRSPGS